MASLGRSSAMIAAGTMASRVLGLVRTVLLVQVLGEFFVGDAFAVANGLPSTIFNIISAGVLTAVFVPQIVKSRQHADGGNAFVSKLFTLSTVVLTVVTILATIAAPLLVLIYAGAFKGGAAQVALATAFAYWCIPQVLFYGLFALVGETFNARNVYGPYTWAPVVNNVFSIAGLILFMTMFQTPMTVMADWTPDRIAFIGIVTTGGIIAQFLVLLLFWRRAGLKLRPDFQWRGVGLSEIARLGGWTFAMVIIAQIAGAIQSQLVSNASGDSPAQFSMNNAFLVYILPYSIIVLSIGTPYFTRISEHAAEGRKDELVKDIDSSIRTLGVFIVLATAALAVAAVPASRLFTSDADSALQVAPVLWAYLANLIPVAILFIVQRTFYVYGDTRTPFYFTVLQQSIVIATAFAAYWLLPEDQLGVGIAAGQTFATIVQTVVAILLLRRRIGSLHSRSWLTAYARFIVAGIAAAAVGWVTYELLGGSHSWMVSNDPTIVGKLTAIPGLAIIGVVAAIVYVIMLRLLRAPELQVAIDTAKRMLGR